MMSRLKPLSEFQRAALPNILSLLGLSGSKLTQGEDKSLCDRFYSVPYEHRTDVVILSGNLELALLSARAMNRAESTPVIKTSPYLIGLVKDLQGCVQSMAPSNQMGEK